MYIFIIMITLIIPLDCVEVKLLIPKFVQTGSSVTFVCQYNMEGKSLYSVKWYRGNHEFFRYLPAEKPAMKSFRIHGIEVDHLGSSAHQVTLLNVPKHISGKISCEVSSDADDTFSTASDSSYLTVSDIKRPILSLSSNLLRSDVPLQINCSAQITDPLPKIVFYIGDHKVDPHYVRDISPGLASLSLPKLEINENTYYQSFRVRCEAKAKGYYELSSSSIPVIPQPILDFKESINKSDKMDRTLCLLFLCLFFCFFVGK